MEHGLGEAGSAARNADQPRLKYLRIADGVRTAIREGRYANGGFLPPAVTLAAEFGVNRLTVTRALEYKGIQRGRSAISSLVPIGYGFPVAKNRC